MIFKEGNLYRTKLMFYLQITHTKKIFKLEKGTIITFLKWDKEPGYYSKVCKYFLCDNIIIHDMIRTFDAPENYFEEVVLNEF